MNYKDRIRPLGELANLCTAFRQQKKTIALANGGFDLIHIGHMRYLQAAASAADILVVAVNSDRSLRKLKGSGRALIAESGRAEIIAAVDGVDYVTVFDELTVENVLRCIRPDFHCKGSDYTEDTVPEKGIVEEYGGKILILGGEKVRSSSTLISSLIKS